MIFGTPLQCFKILFPHSKLPPPYVTALKCCRPGAMHPLHPQDGAALAIRLLTLFCNDRFAQLYSAACPHHNPHFEISFRLFHFYHRVQSNTIGICSSDPFRNLRLTDDKLLQGRVQVLKVLIRWSSPITIHFLSLKSKHYLQHPVLRSKYSSRHPVLKHPQSSYM